MKYLVITLVFFFCFLFAVQAIKSVKQKIAPEKKLSSEEDLEKSSDEVNYNEPEALERKPAGSKKELKSEKSSPKSQSNNFNNSTYDNVTILDLVNNQNDDIIESICDFESKVRNTIEKINKHLNRVEAGLNQISESSTTRQKLYRKFARLAAQINYAVSELYRTKNSIELLQTSKCSNVKTLQDNFSVVEAMPKDLITMLKDALSKTKINMSLVILN